MEQWTPWLLMVVGGIGVVVWWAIRKVVQRMDDMSAKLDQAATQLTKLDGVSLEIAAVSLAVHNLEKLVSDELRRFDVRITWLEAHAPTRTQAPRP